MTTRLDLARWRGLAALGRDAVVAASDAVERVHLATARRPFTVLEALPITAAPAALVHTVHDVTVSSVHALVRVTARSVAAALDIALVTAERVGGGRGGGA